MTAPDISTTQTTINGIAQLKHSKAVSQKYSEKL